MLPITFSNGDRAVRAGHALVLSFAGPRRLLSTSAYHGGMREDLRCAYNYDMSHGKIRICEPLGSTAEEHMRLVGQSLGLPEENTGLCTGAQMDALAVAAETWAGVTVTALVTAGIDENGGRAGDPASWQEEDGVLGLPVGTVNLLLHFDCNLSPGALAAALLTATEAKCAAIQELLLPSVVSSGLATGSGTDGAVLIADPTSKTRRTDAGKHGKLGEQIGKAVLRATREALDRQTGASPARLRDALRHLGRFGITEEALLKRAPGLDPAALQAVCRREEVWTAAALCAHLLDLLQWGVLTKEEATAGLGELLSFPIAEKQAVQVPACWLLALAGVENL